MPKQISSSSGCDRYAGLCCERSERWVVNWGGAGSVGRMPGCSVDALAIPRTPSLSSFKAPIRGGEDRLSELRDDARDQELQARGSSLFMFLLGPRDSISSVQAPSSSSDVRCRFGVDMLELPLMLRSTKCCQCGRPQNELENLSVIIRRR